MKIVYKVVRNLGSGEFYSLRDGFNSVGYILNVTTHPHDRITAGRLFVFKTSTQARNFIAKYVASSIKYAILKCLVSRIYKHLYPNKNVKLALKLSKHYAWMAEFRYCMVPAGTVFVDSVKPIKIIK